MPEAGDLEISSTAEDGHRIRGSYRVAAGVVHAHFLTAAPSKLRLAMTQPQRSLKFFCRNWTEKNAA